MSFWALIIICFSLWQNLVRLNSSLVKVLRVTFLYCMIVEKYIICILIWVIFTFPNFFYFTSARGCNKSVKYTRCVPIIDTKIKYQLAQKIKYLYLVILKGTFAYLLDEFYECVLTCHISYGFWRVNISGWRNFELFDHVLVSLAAFYVKFCCILTL